MSIKLFIDQNRQMGSTTWIAEATIASNGYLIVSSLNVKAHVMRDHPRLRDDQVITTTQLKSGLIQGRPKGPIFVDVTVLYTLE